MWKKTKAAISGRETEEIHLQYQDTTKHIQELKEEIEEQQKAATRSIRSLDAPSNTYTSHRYNYTGPDIIDTISSDEKVQMLLIDVLNKFNETGEVEGPEWKKLIKEITQYKEKKNLRTEDVEYLINSMRSTYTTKENSW